MKFNMYILLVASLLIISCSSKEQSTERPMTSEESTLGELQHGFKLNPVTQEKFDEGLLLLHNFEYEDALTAFEAATESDSTEVLAHWGEAMCHYKALWRLQNTDKGKAILTRLGNTAQERIASINDPIKKIMWELVEIMYGEGEFDERNNMIKEHLATAHQQYPEHQEIAAFYALSLIWATEEYGDGSDDLRLAASITDKITKVNPLHPGALHYKIHALDGPTSAKEALDAADAYAKVAADAAHALHMPSHIYLATGDWKGVVESNQRSYDASVDRMIAKELEDGSRGYHSYAWLHYGLLQQGKYSEAEKILKDMIMLVPKDPTKGARGYLLGMQSRQLAATENMSDEVKMDTDVKVDDIGILPQSVRSFLKAQIAYDNKDTQTIKYEIDWLANKITIASQDINEGGAAMCSAGTSRYAPTENAVRSARVIMNQMEGFVALLNKDSKLFENHLQKAVELEDQTNFPAGPPRITMPSYEQYGDWLVAQGKHEEANELFDKALLRMPRRTKSLQGKVTCLKALKEQDELRKVEEELRSIFDEA